MIPEEVKNVLRDRLETLRDEAAREKSVRNRRMWLLKEFEILKKFLEEGDGSSTPVTVQGASGASSAESEYPSADDPTIVPKDLLRVLGDIGVPADILNSKYALIAWLRGKKIT